MRKRVLCCNCQIDEPVVMEEDEDGGWRGNTLLRCPVCGTTIEKEAG